MERDLQDQEGLSKFSIEMVIMKQMQHIFDDMIIYVTCEVKTPSHRVMQIADQCKDMISRSLS